jgi:hypothetical protein
MTALQLSNLDARLAYLAIQYHLSRPGSELQRETAGAGPEGLASTMQKLDSQIDKAIVSVELNDQQRERLSSAIAGAINELKSTPLLEAGGRESMVPVFRETLRRLFPSAADDPDEATQLARHLLTLRGRLDQIAPSPEERSSVQRKSSWKFWQRH